MTELQTHPDASIPAATPAADDAPAHVLPPPHPARERADRIARWTFVALAVLLTACLARVVQLQVAPGKNLSPFIDGRVSTHTIPGVRGDLQDRRGRILHATRFGYRVFVDPTRFPQPVDKPMIDLADALGIPVAEVAQRLVPRLAQNQRHLAAKNDKDPWTEPDRPLARYVSIGGVLEDWRVDAVRGLRIPGVHLETRSVREAADDGLTTAIVGRVGVDHNGLLGAENRMDRELKPTSGELRYVQDARARPLWVEPGAYTPPVRGEDVRLSLDLDIQRIAEEELSGGVRAADAAGGRLVAMDPNTGELLAMVDIVRDLPGLVDYSWDYPIGQEPSGHKPRYRTIANDPLRSVAPGMGRNRIVEDVYEPGSTFKSFMWAAATELGVARPGEIIDTESGQWVTPYGRRVADVTRLPRQSWTDVLVNSSNIGMAKVTSRMSFLQMHDAVRKFGFGSRTGLPLPGESPGLVTTMRNWSKYTQTSVAMGHEVAVTPIQMVRAFSVFARSGELAGTIPDVRLTAAAGEQLASTRRPLPTTLRVLPREVAELARSTMRGVTHKLDERMASRDPSADAPRYEAFGKSGTAEIPLGKAPAGKRRPKGSDGYFQDQYNSSFIAGAPLEDPRIVVLVVIDDPGPNRVATRTHYGASTAGPVARRFIERSLAYLGVPPSIAPAKVASAPAVD